jgi:molecular chaperone GrpE
MTPPEDSPRPPQGPPGTPGPEAEDVPVDGEALRPGGRTEAADDGSSEVSADLDALAKAEQERDEYLELAKRAQADFENYRKRMAAEVQASANRGKASVAEGMVEAIENLERALASKGIDDAESANVDDDFVHGVSLVYLGMKETLTRNGIESVDPSGEKFDPQLHEALSAIPSEGVESGTVVEVMQKGYRLGDQLVRPARVVVAE